MRNIVNTIKAIADIAIRTGKNLFKTSKIQKIAFVTATALLAAGITTWASDYLFTPEVSASMPDADRSSGTYYYNQVTPGPHMRWTSAFLLDDYSEHRKWERAIEKNVDEYEIYWELGEGTSYNRSNFSAKSQKFYYTVNASTLNNISKSAKKFNEIVEKLETNSDPEIVIDVTEVERKDAKIASNFLQETWYSYIAIRLTTDQLNWGEWDRDILSTFVWVSDEYDENSKMEEAKDMDLKRFENIYGWGDKVILFTNDAL